MEDLPKGLLSTAAEVSSELDTLEAIELAQIIQLWKIYNANPSVHEGDIGYRLENLFWRTWSSEHLGGSIGGNRLATLFLRITEPSPVSLRTTQQVKKARKKKPSRSKKTPDPNQQQQQQHPPHSPTATRAPLPPILKKSSTSGESQKTTRLLLTGEEGQCITRKPDNPPTPVPPPLGPAASHSRPAHKKPHYVAPKARNTKRRPVLMRRKSSQTSGASTRNHSPQPLSPRTVESPPPFQGQTSVFEVPGEEPPVPTPAGEPQIPASTATDAAAAAELNPRAEGDDLDNRPVKLPPAFVSELKTILRNKSSPQSTKSTPPKWGFVTTDDWTHYDVRYVCPENYEQPSSQSLVDKGFRARFSERLHQEQEFYSSSLAAATAAGMGLAEYLEATSAESSRSRSRSHTDTAPSPSKPESSTLNFAPTEADTLATSVPIMTPSRVDSSSPFSRRASVLPLTPFSLPRGRGQLSLLIEESRKKEVDSDTNTK
ncbi:hypothetical protein BDV59DRAFT_127347 [Aspergillus ambiguus]|uniref:GATA-like domain-containing protein n=1 Tax=Aspergillus ambiguus TaxID=176160 RepID=UPI003CCD12C6